MKKFVICETVIHYHEVEVDEEIDIEKVVEDANRLIKMSSGVEALSDVLEDYKYHHGLECNVKPDYCGASTESLIVYDEVSED